MNIGEMILSFPLRVRAFSTSEKDPPCAYIIKDAKDRGIHVACEAAPLRREVANLWTPDEAKELATLIARLLTDRNDQKI